jgi:flagellar hook-associated protein 1 FlgK
MATYQRSLDVASNNIANAGNKDYRRQRAVLSTETTQQYAGITWGSGIKMDDIERIRDSLTESQIISNTQRHSYFDKSSVLLGQIEEIYSEPSELGLSNLMGDFFSSWSELSANPTSSALRGNVVYSAENLGSKVEEINDSYKVVKSSIYYEFKDDVREINNTLSTLQSVNRQISEARGIGQNANDLMDKRDLLVDDLSKLTNITVNYESDETVNVSIGGVFAVDKGNYTEFELSSVEGELAMVTKNGGRKADLTGGEMGALVDTFTNKIPSYQNQLDDIINQLVTSVNDIHNSGQTLDDPPQPGLDFFSGYENGKLTINDAILDDYNKIAASSDGTSGNGEIAIQIFELSDAKLLNGNRLIDSYSTLLSGVGSDKQNADSLEESGKMVLEQLQNQKDSYSAVSVDEEMLDVMKFQKAYEASAKLISMADEMLEILMQMV